VNVTLPGGRVAVGPGGATTSPIGSPVSRLAGAGIADGLLLDAELFAGAGRADDSYALASLPRPQLGRVPGCAGAKPPSYTTPVDVNSWGRWQAQAHHRGCYAAAKRSSSSWSSWSAQASRSAARMSSAAGPTRW
jgi:hypothetical protein